jgi:hypothetical protein
MSGSSCVAVCGAASALVLSPSVDHDRVGLRHTLFRAAREEIAMEPGEMKYGVPNVVYDIIQTVGNLLQGVEKMTEYAGDAEAAGDADAATVFRTVAEGNRVAAQALLKRLKVHLNDF